MDFREYSIEELVSKITSKEMSARELTQEALNNHVSYTHLTLPTKA